ncbi:complexed with cef1p [Coemansia erecta]|uniref:Complexed with cef1p n=1 Tax=Coemansia erecta TaxID=147472 RepID=A0A9W8CSR8_9FUNG|nr:complexed with cef1p [Coemansia erecta]
MTTAARPTFNPAKGKASDEFSYMTSSKDLPSHTRLKTRRPGQGKEGEYTVEELKQELKEAERRHFEAKGDPKSLTAPEDSTQDTESTMAANRTKYIELAQMLDAASSDEDEEDGAENSDSGSGSDSEDGDESSDEEDETAMLMRELEKIKRERAEEKAREEKEAEENMLLNASSVLGSNPLLAQSDFSVKRRWNDDVIFRNQAKGDDDKPQKRFINDMQRSDFHRKFMRKYIH